MDDDSQIIEDAKVEITPNESTVLEPTEREAPPNVEDFSTKEDNSVHVHVEIPETKADDKKEESLEKTILSELLTAFTRIESAINNVSEKIDVIVTPPVIDDTPIVDDSEIIEDDKDDKIEDTLPPKDGEKFSPPKKRKWSIY